MTDEKSSRRSVLKSALVGATTLAGTGLAGASRRFDHEKHYERAVQARENSNRNGLQTFRNVLKNTPEFEVTTNDVTKTPEYTSGDVGTEHVYPQDVDIWMTETVYSDYVYVDCQFEVEYDYNDGDQPYDPCALGWEEREYDYDNYNYSSDYIDYGHFETTGAKFDYHDEADDCHCRKTDRYFGCRALKEDGTADTRRVIGSLWHTWSNVEITSVGISTDGIVSVSLSDETKKWDHPIQADIYESDA